VLVITTQMRAAPAVLALVRPLNLAPNQYDHVNACFSFEFHIPKITVSTTPNPALTGETNFAFNSAISGLCPCIARSDWV
jgi:hypothetical protein